MSDATVRSDWERAHDLLNQHGVLAVAPGEVKKPHVIHSGHVFAGMALHRLLGRVGVTDICSVGLTGRRSLQWDGGI